MALVELQNIRLSYGNVEVLKGVSLRLESAEFAAVLGPSGCGKTSLLRIIAGFSEYTGTLRIDGQDVANLPPHRRNIGIVFQDYALFPHQTVEGNIGYGLRLRSLPRSEIRDRVGALLDLLKLNGFAARYPEHLSGGQRQRVAIARALAIEPKMLLLDEPLSALDKKLREEMQVELRQIQKTVGITTLFVTHDQEEALALADSVIVMTEGTIRQVGSPAEIYMRPADAFVAEFIGQSNLFNAVVTQMRGNDVLARLDSGESIVLKSDAPINPRSPIVFSVRPERLRIGKHGESASLENALDGKIQHVIFMGSHSQVRVATAGNRSIKVQTSDCCREGDDVTLSWNSWDTVILSSGMS